MRPGRKNLITDIPGLRVGNAQDARIKTGVTVLVGDAPMTAAVHVMGGAPGTRETDLLAPDKLVQQVDAITLSGGSAFGLDAASGVADGLRALGRGFQVGDQNIPIVPGAILFDLLNGGEKGWQDNPYKPMGLAALAAASVEFEQGTAGCGTGATTATFKGGLGSASVVMENGITVGALVGVNALGSATVDDTATFWAGAWEIDNEFGGLGGPTRSQTGFQPAIKGAESTNTTIAIVATNAILTQAEAQRMATAAHDGMARALVPSHTPFDGDLVFGVSTGEVALPDPALDPLMLGHAAATCLARAIAKGVYHATPSPNDTHSTWSEKHAKQRA